MRDPSTIFKTWTWKTKKEETGVSVMIFDPQGKEFATQVMEAAKNVPADSAMGQVAEQMKILYGDIKKLKRVAS